MAARDIRQFSCWAAALTSALLAASCELERASAQKDWQASVARQNEASRERALARPATAVGYGSWRTYRSSHSLTYSIYRAYRPTYRYVCYYTPSHS